jgi:hypothetical protein
MFGAMVSLRFKAKDMTPLWKLCDERRIWTTKGNPLRISTHIHTRPADVDLLLEMADKTFKV